MQPHQQRVVDEQKELSLKLEKLRDFLETDTYKSLPKQEQDLLSLQSQVMSVYVNLLGERISLFGNYEY